MKRIGAYAVVLIAAAAAAIMSSCDWRVYRNPNVLVDILSSDPTTLNPLLAPEVAASSVYAYIYESLLERNNETLVLEPRLAKRCEISPDHLTYTFWLKEGITWQDGTPLTANDVIFTFEKIRDPKVDAARLRNYFRDVKKIEKVDDMTVRFTYARPYFKALEIIGGEKIIPRHIFENGQDFNSHPYNRKPVGTGPYRFEEWKTGRRIVLKRYENYWDKKPAITGITFKIVPDQTVSFELLKKGAIDLTTLRPIQWKMQTQSPSFMGKFAKYSYYLPNYSFIGWNLRKPFFEDRRVRAAMTMLIDRQKIVDKVLFGEGEVVSGNFYRFGPAYDESIAPLPYDPEMAVRLLEEAGWIDHDGDGVRDKNGIPFRFTLTYPSGNPLGKSIGIFLRSELEKIGIDMTVEQLEFATLIGKIEKRVFDACLLGWATPLEEDPYQVWHSTQAVEGSNFVGFLNPSSDRLIEEARREFDPDLRAELYRKFHAILNKEQPYTFLFAQPSLVAVAKRFENVKVYKLGLDSLEWTVGPWPALIEW